MNRIIIFCFLLGISLSAKGQESEVIVRYDFTKNSSPPMNVFYLKIFIDGIFADSTKPHMPHHNMANAVKTEVTIGPHNVRIEGYIKAETNDSFVVSKVMEWKGNFNVTKRKCRIGIKMNGNYEVEVWTVPDF